MEEKLGRHPCPVCGRTIFEEYDSYVICEFCGWEDNALQEEEPDLGGGPNASLNDCRKQYQEKIKADPNYTWAKECDERREKKGIFWIVDREDLSANEPYLFRIPVDLAGVPIYLTPIPPLNSKHGDNYNHKKTWEECLTPELRLGKPYNFYPRGRVEIKDTKSATIFLTPDLATEDVIAYLKEQFCLKNRVLKIVADGSEHYRYLQAAEGQNRFNDTLEK